MIRLLNTRVVTFALGLVPVIALTLAIFSWSAVYPQSSAVNDVSGPTGPGPGPSGGWS
jgi:hypothetical protein